MEYYVKITITNLSDFQPPFLKCDITVKRKHQKQNILFYNVSY